MANHQWAVPLDVVAAFLCGLWIRPAPQRVALSCVSGGAVLTAVSDETSWLPSWATLCVLISLCLCLGTYVQDQRRRAAAKLRRVIPRALFDDSEE